MKVRTLPSFLAFTVLLAFCLPTDALAAKAGKKGAKKAAGAVPARFDKDRNGTIDSTEADALRKQYEPLAALDTDKDGKLSDSEIAAAKVGKGKGGKKKPAAQKQAGKPGAKKKKAEKKKAAKTN